MSTITEIIRSHRSPRDFLPDPVPGSVIREVLEDARWAPSHSNTQPWTTHIISGPARDALSTALLEAHDAERRSPDFTETYGDGVHLERSAPMPPSRPESSTGIQCPVSPPRRKTTHRR